MGIVVTPTGKIDFGPACAAAGPACVAAPASTSAPVLRMVLRSTVSMRVLPGLFSLFDGVSSPPGHAQQAILKGAPRRSWYASNAKAPRERGPSHSSLALES